MNRPLRFIAAGAAAGLAVALLALLVASEGCGLAILGGPEPIPPCPGTGVVCPRGYHCTTSGPCEADGRPPVEWAARSRDAGAGDAR